MSSRSSNHDIQLDDRLLEKSVDGSFSIPWTHQIRFTHGAFSEGNHVLSSILPEGEGQRRLCTVIDAGLLEARPDLIDSIDRWQQEHAARIHPSGPPVIIPGGESTKNGWDSFETVAAAINDQHVCRRSIVLIIGGGAVLDTAGFAAATSHRGIGVIRMPSTTLAQGDAGIGVKNGINAFGVKNFLGSFSPPLAVVNDLSLLDSLDEAHWRGGLSEAVKVALLKHPPLLDFIEQASDRLRARDLETMESVMLASAKLHMDHIVHGGDPFENQHARPLDLGHWAAHRIEAITQWRMPHGDAVAIGLAIDLDYTVRIGRLDQEISSRVLECLCSLGFLSCSDCLSDGKVVLEGIEEFREHLGGCLTIPTITAPGALVELHEIDSSIMLDAIESVNGILSADS
ncbi:MAG: 3-dehydroquinate synthase [Phycisphaerales bacterium]|nr:3-dehydroquinate synthase [Phycisphaerales bacterium]